MTYQSIENYDQLANMYALKFNLNSKSTKMIMFQVIAWEKLVK